MYSYFYPPLYHHPINRYKNFSRQNPQEKASCCFNIGEEAPDFTLPGVINGELGEVTLSDLKGKWVVLFFYGSDFTFV